MQDFVEPLHVPASGHAPTGDGHAANLEAEQIAANPKLLSGLANLSLSLREIFRVNPRLGRTLASHQRWLLSQAACALHFEYDPADKSSGLTVGRLRDLITSTSAASRNTVLNFMEEMRHYRFVRDVALPHGTRTRRRRLEVTEFAEETLQRWFASNLSVLDGLDGGARIEIWRRHPALFRLAQPLAARACVSDPRWLNPPESIGLFQWTEGGALAMDELVARCGQTQADSEGRFHVGAVNIRAMADEYLMSHTHLQRLFRKAAEIGVVGWTGARRKADLWVSGQFLLDYAHWQSVKLSHVDAAFWKARAMIAGEESTDGMASLRKG